MVSARALLGFIIRDPKARLMPGLLTVTVASLASLLCVVVAAACSKWPVGCAPRRLAVAWWDCAYLRRWARTSIHIRAAAPALSSARPAGPRDCVSLRRRPLASFIAVTLTIMLGPLNQQAGLVSSPCRSVARCLQFPFLQGRARLWARWQRRDSAPGGGTRRRRRGTS